MATIQIRVDDNLKREADALFSDIGLDTPTAIRAFLTQSILHQGLPFALTRVNPETREAMEELCQIKEHPERFKHYSDVDQMMEDLLSDEV